jgi:hypothetical protein
MVKTKKEKKMSDTLDTLKVDFTNDFDEPFNNKLGDSIDFEKPSAVKEWLVNYVGEKVDPENDEVTLAMVLDTVADEFPEFVLPIAEENFIRGYKQAMADVELGEKLLNESNQNIETQVPKWDTDVSTENEE